MAITSEVRQEIDKLLENVNSGGGLVKNMAQLMSTLKNLFPDFSRNDFPFDLWSSHWAGPKGSPLLIFLKVKFTMIVHFVCGQIIGLGQKTLATRS